MEGRAAADGAAGEVRDDHARAHRDGLRDFHYKDLRQAIVAISDALNAELRALVEAGCEVVRLEEPQIHMLARRR